MWQAQSDANDAAESGNSKCKFIQARVVAEGRWGEGGWEAAHFRSLPHSAAGSI